MSSESASAASGSARPWLRWGVIPLVAVLALALVAVWFVWDRETLSADEIRAVADDAAEHLDEYTIAKITDGGLTGSRLDSLDESIRREVNREIAHQVEHAALRLDVPVPKITRPHYGSSGDAEVTISDADGEDPVCLHFERQYSEDIPDGEDGRYQTIVDLTADVENGACG